MSKSKIEWTDETWNPVTGCSKVSAGCKYCYAEREWQRMTRLVQAYAGREFGDVRTHADRLDQPLRWKRPRKVFVNSMSDLFHDDVPFEFIDRVFAVMALAPQHTFQVLTKRPARMLEYFQSFRDRAAEARGFNVCAWASEKFGITDEQVSAIGSTPKGLPNVWLGVSVEDQAAADERIPLLLQTPAAVRWISVEPLLGPIDLDRVYLSTSHARWIDWAVVGGESGPKARPMHPDWVRSLRDQCAVAGVPFLFKQWGEWAPNWLNNAEGEIPSSVWMDRMGKKIAGRLLDGVQHDGYPIDALGKDPQS